MNPDTFSFLSVHIFFVASPLRNSSSSDVTKVQGTGKLQDGAYNPGWLAYVLTGAWLQVVFLCISTVSLYVLTREGLQSTQFSLLIT